MKISVIVPCRNCANTIEEAYRSVAAQSFNNIEVLLIDDGSTDDTLSVLRRIAAEDVRVRVFEEAKNLGVSATRNKGLAAATGDFLFFMDADDILQSACLQILSDAVQCEDIDFVRGKHFWWLSESNETKTNPEEELNFVEILGISPSAYPQIINVFTCWNSLIRTALVRAHNISFPEDMRLGEDRQFNILIFEVARRVSLLNEYTYLWRKDASNPSQATQLLVSDPAHTMSNALRFGLLARRPWVESHRRHCIYLSTTVLVEVISRLTSFSRLLERNLFPDTAKQDLIKVFSVLRPQDINLALPSIKGRAPAFDRLYELGAAAIGTTDIETFLRRFLIELGKVRRTMSFKAEETGIAPNSAREVIFAAFLRAVARRSPADLQSEIEALRRSKLVDESFYRTQYPDVADAQVDIVTHYQRHGVSELRDPNEWFSTAGYLAQYPDLITSGINPLFHYANQSSFLLGANR
jgi:glycosyltransferase involved in cell wall biosynthesis